MLMTVGHMTKEDISCPVPIFPLCVCKITGNYNKAKDPMQKYFHRMENSNSIRK